MYQLGLIGNPVSHSKSPDLHHNFLNRAGLKGSYELVHVEEDELQEKVEELVNQGFSGFNVTVPYKEKVLNLLDSLEESAELMGSVNTVKIENGKLVGYNTDGKGYVRSLIESYPDFLNQSKHKRVLLIGAGGAAKGIAHQLNQYLFHDLMVTNRSYDKAEALSHNFAQFRPMLLEDISVMKGQFDLIINTTTVGMYPSESEQIISLEGVGPSCIVSDIVYKPKWTALLKDAKYRGCQLLFGESMLYYQALNSFEIWTNRQLNFNLMN
ncbi:shikimate dehydrogenase [Alkalibacillus silvisoli]|uniref:Shikimate dehydrogenase (NADP(+)) n=1 Tax=Alkalibacillus silvisoli TaxID=392823 RepID=A0ABP3JLL2_9BACI